MDKGLRFWGFCLAVILCLMIGAYTLFFGGPLTWNLLCVQGKKAFLETGLFFLWMLACCLAPVKEYYRFTGILCGFGAAAWLHQCFLPLVVSGVWLWEIFMLGGGLRRLVWKNEMPGKALQGLTADFLIGSGSWISFICILSAFGIGGLGRIRLLAAVLFIVLVSWHLVFFRKSLLGFGKKIRRNFRKKTDGNRESLCRRILPAMLYAMLFTMVMIQLARINLQPDYDSLHYGLRSPYILDNGRGIYENLGNINLVYTYPKGFEILSFPLAGTATFGYVLCFNFWLTLFALWLVYGLARQLSGSKKQGLLAAVFASMIPGVMNMAITAKSDTVTLVCQLCILCAATGIFLELGEYSGKDLGEDLGEGFSEQGEDDSSERFFRRGLSDLSWTSVKWWFAIGTGGCFLSYSMKPTSLVFSTILSISCLLCLIRGMICALKRVSERDSKRVSERDSKRVSERDSKHVSERVSKKTSKRVFKRTSRNILKKKEALPGEIFEGRDRWLKIFGLLLVPSAGAWAGTWIRTYRMVGVPTTSVFTSLWEKMGFEVRWPFAFLSIPNQGLEMGLSDSLLFLGKRLFHVLFSPVGEDMGHVIIAWGSSLTALFLLAWMFWGRRRGCREGRKIQADFGKSGAWNCVSFAALAIGGMSLLSLYLLWQVDGNYFMLLYVLLDVLGILSLASAGERVTGADFRGFWSWPEPGKKPWAVFSGLAAVFLFQVSVTLSTSWAGNPGFTPINIRHKGYVNHQQQIYEEMCSRGSQAIWSVLAQDPRARVIAVGEHPQTLLFPCNVQSYYDVTGSGGNVRLVKTLDNFKEFLDYAEIQYLYVQAGFLEEGTRCYDVVRFLVEDGSLWDIRYENGNMLARLNPDQAHPVDPEGEAEEFYRNIRLKDGEEQPE